MIHEWMILTHDLADTVTRGGVDVAGDVLDNGSSEYGDTASMGMGEGKRRHVQYW